jgi:hypothetical protein
MARPAALFIQASPRRGPGASPSACHRVPAGGNLERARQIGKVTSPEPPAK